MKDPTESWGDKQYDVFICHASEDKQEIARPLAQTLDSLGLQVWYDEFEIGWGDSITRSIDHGLSKTVYGVVILSNAFFEKEWTEYEYRGLITRMVEDNLGLKPLWFGVGKDKVCAFSPALADLSAVRITPDNIEEVAQDFLQMAQAEGGILRHRLNESALRKIHRYKGIFWTPLYTFDPDEGGVSTDEPATENFLGDVYEDEEAQALQQALQGFRYKDELLELAEETARTHPSLTPIELVRTLAESIEEDEAVLLVGPEDDAWSWQAHKTVRVQNDILERASQAYRYIAAELLLTLGRKLHRDA